MGLLKPCCLQNSTTYIPGKMDSSAGSSSQVAPTPEQCQAHFELGLTLALYTWPSLSLAVTNNWGGPDSEEKRQWFVGATIDVLKDDETDGSEDDEEEDVDMEEAPPLVRVREPVVAEVDEDGFTKVTKKKR